MTSVTQFGLGTVGLPMATTLHRDGVEVTATDTDPAAAGDSFCAALADALVRGEPIVEAVRWAVRVGAATTLRAGAQPSLPTPPEVDSLLDRCRQYDYGSIRAALRR